MKSIEETRARNQSAVGVRVSLSSHQREGISEHPFTRRRMREPRVGSGEMIPDPQWDLWLSKGNIRSASLLPNTMAGEMSRSHGPRALGCDVVGSDRAAIQKKGKWRVGMGRENNSDCNCICGKRVPVPKMDRKGVKCGELGPSSASAQIPWVYHPQI